jgi:hypothetical protein
MSDVSVSIGVTGKDAVTGAFSEVGKAGEALGSVFTGMVGSLAALAAGYVSVQGVIEVFKGGLDFAKEFSELSERTGVASEKLVVLQRAFENNGVAAEDLGSIINKLQKNLEAATDPTSKQAEKIRELGLSVSNLLLLSPDEQFAAIAQAIGKINDPAQKTAIAMELLGKAGGKTLALMNNYSEEMDVASKQTSTLQTILNRSSGAFDNVGDNFTVLGKKLREFGVGLLDPIVESLGVLTAKMANFDAAAFGEQVMSNMSKPIRALLESLASGEWSTALGLIYETTKLNLMKALDELYRWGKTASAFLSSIFGELFNSDSYLFNYLRTAFDLLGSYISRALNEAIVGILDGIPGMGKKIELLKYQIQSATQSISLQQDALKNGWEVAAGEAQKMVSNAIDAAEYTYKTADGIMDVGTQQALVNKLSDDALEKAKSLRQEAELHSVAMEKIAKEAGSFADKLTGASDTFKGFQSGENSLANLAGLNTSSATGPGPVMTNDYKPVAQPGGGGYSNPKDTSILQDVNIKNGVYKNTDGTPLGFQADLSASATSIQKNSALSSLDEQIAKASSGYSPSSLASLLQRKAELQQQLQIQGLNQASENQAQRDYKSQLGLSDSANQQDIISGLKMKYSAQGFNLFDSAKLANEDYANGVSKYGGESLSDSINKTGGPIDKNKSKDGSAEKAQPSSPETGAIMIVKQVVSDILDYMKQSLPQHALS